MANRHLASHSLLHFCDGGIKYRQYSFEVLNQANAEAAEKFHIGLPISQKSLMKITPQLASPKYTRYNGLNNTINILII